MGKSGRPYKVHEELTELRPLVREADTKSIRMILSNHGMDAFDGDKKNGINMEYMFWTSRFSEVVD